jgi:putative FmdB family regulatory protein
VTLFGFLMPTYEYRCACGVRFNLEHGMFDDSRVECPLCLVPVSRVPNFGSSIFRGSGFYSNEK